jgi:uncharacterized membrane protein YkoI
MLKTDTFTTVLRSGKPTTRTRTAAGVVCAAASCTLLLTGCGDNAGQQSSSGSHASASASSAGGTTGGLTEDQRERQGLIPADKTGYRKAASIAVHEVPGGTLIESELKRDNNGKPVWRTTVAAKDGTKNEVDVVAANGKVAGSRTDPDQDSDDKREVLNQLAEAKISSQKAVDTATGRTKGTVTSVELEDTDNGTTIRSVDIVTTNDWNKTTYDVNATNGKILRKHVDRD